ncbi:hypothetical protein PEDI_48070 [Persicobacter diffluens]|uniref:Uncharacterized protein n=1 Tax=Persicobacter diffluens TaxID=981 RepID=A0AAN5ALR2_9BACT|nr:hypothetical protein PEDI_48070 [Persicobacter diffluens]
MWENLLSPYALADKMKLGTNPSFFALEAK